MPYSSQSWNRYSYALNSPYRFTDPTGYDQMLIVYGTAAGLSGTQLSPQGHMAWAGQNQDGTWYRFDQEPLYEQLGPMNLNRMLQGYDIPGQANVRELAGDALRTFAGDMSSPDVSVFYYTTSPEQDEMSLQRAMALHDAYADGRLLYNLHSRNCKDVAIEVAMAGGIEVADPDEIWSPNSWVDFMRPVTSTWDYFVETYLFSAGAK
jgi:hypothetical protein